MRSEPDLSNRLFAKRAAIIAKKASSWASDSLDMSIDPAGPVSLETAQRFVAEIRKMLAIIVRDAKANDR